MSLLSPFKVARQATVAVVIVLAALVCLASAHAQVTQASTKVQEKSDEYVDPYGRTTPEGAVRGFVTALGQKDYERASLYLDLRRYSSAQRRRRGPELSKQFEVLLTRGGQFFPRAAQSNAARGRLNDGLDPDLERVGLLGWDDRQVDILLERIDRPPGAVWLIARETLDTVPEAIGAEAETLIDRSLPEHLRDITFLGAPLGHWLVLVGLTGAAYLLAWAAISLGLHLDTAFCKWRRRETRSFLTTLAPPTRLLLTSILTTTIASRIGVSIVARESYGRLLEIVGWVATAWLAWRIVDVMNGIVRDRLHNAGRGQMASIAAFIGRLVKVVIVAVGAIAILDTLGYDVTAGIAALGIGGLALALGAQKVVENLVASMSILSDQPVRVGEFCKIGDTLGTVEELGIRSTRIRTLENTLVVIPNSDLAAKQIENFARRHQFWFHPIINLDYRTSPTDLRSFLERLRTLLASQTEFRDPPRVRLLGLGSDRFPVEVFAYVTTADNDEFLKVQEKVTILILDLVAEMGLHLAPPTVSIVGGAAEEGEHRE
jgi:MscS family membrane protein